MICVLKTDHQEGSNVKMIKRKYLKYAVYILIALIFVVLVIICFNILRVSRPGVNERGHIFEMCIAPPYGNDNSYYISVSDTGILYYKIGKSENLLDYLWNMQISDKIIKTPIVEKEIYLNSKSYRKLLDILSRVEKTNTPCPEEDFGYTVYDATYKCFWYNDEYYDLSASVMGEGYDCYKELEEFLFGNIDLRDTE